MVRLSDNEYDWVDSASQAPLQGPVDYSNPNPWAWTPEPESNFTWDSGWGEDQSWDQGNGWDTGWGGDPGYQGPVDYSNPDPWAWTAEPAPDYSYELSMDQPSPIDFSWGAGWEAPQDRLDAAAREEDDRPWWKRAASAVGSGLEEDWSNLTSGLREDASTEGGFLNTVFSAHEKNADFFVPGDSADLPWYLRIPLQTAVDPLTYAGGAIAPALSGTGRLGTLAAEFLAPTLGEGSPLAARIGAEIAVNAAGNLGGQYGGELAAEYTDNPFLIGAAGIASGALAGGIAYGGVKGLDNLSSANSFKALDLSSEQGSLTVPGLNRVRGREDPTSIANTAPYLGERMRLPAAMPEDVQPDDIIRVTRDGQRAATSAALALEAEADVHWQSILKDAYVGTDGNLYLRGVPLAAKDMANGLEGAPLQRIIERPGEYRLTPVQRDNVEALAGIAEASAKERDIFGIPINRLSLEDEERFASRLVKQMPESVRARQIVENGTDDLGRRSTGVGRRLSAPKDASRVYEDVADAIRDGYVYENPQMALNAYTARNLDKALSHHVKTLLEPFGQTGADRIDPQFKALWQGEVQSIGKINSRMETALRRAGVAEKQVKELARPLRTLERATNAQQVREGLAAARTQLKTAQADAIAWARVSGGAGEAVRTAKSNLDNLIRRAETIDTQMAALEAQYPQPSAAIRVDRLGRAYTDTVSVAQQAAAIQVQLDALVAKGLKLPVGAAASEVVDTSVLRDMADIRLAGARTAVSQSATDALRAAEEIIPQDATSAIRKMQHRLTLLEQRGGQWKDVAAQLRAELAAARDRVDDMRPLYDAHHDAAMRPPPGRRAVDKALAPHLIGTDFDNNTAVRIEAFYGRGIRIGDKVLNTNIPGARTFHAFTTPMQAIGDFSGTLNQLAIMGANKPPTFLKNLALSMKDMFDETAYQRYLAENASDAAAHGLTIMGGAARNSDFEFGSWIERVPVLGHSQKQFQAMGNRMRIDAYNDAVKAELAAGQPLSDAEKFAKARALNRISGVSNSRATDAEGLLQFAPNFMRAHVENIAYAFTKGGIEGAEARRMMGTWAALGMFTSVGVALAQGRDWTEVVKPFVVDGEKSWTPDSRNLRLNPNFGTIRWAGNDTSVFGTYDSLARLAVVAGDAANRSLQQGDAMQLFDAVGFAASTKGSPGVKLLTDLIKGETFTGADPLSAVEMIKRPLPFTAQNAIQGVQAGLSPLEIAADTIIGGFGAKSNPMTITEKLDAASPGGDFYKLPTERQAAVLAANPDLARQKETFDQLRNERAERLLGKDYIAQAEDNKVFRVLDKIDLEKNDAFSKAAAKYNEDFALAVTDKDRQQAGKDLRDRVASAQAAAANQKLGALATNPDLFAKTNSDPLKKAVSDYYDTFKRASATGKLDFDQQQIFLRELEKTWTPEQIKAVHTEITKTRTSEDPVINKLFADQKAIRDSGYFDGVDKNGKAMNKTEFRREYPELGAKVRQWGYSPASTGIEDISTEFKQKQLQLDDQLKSRAITSKQWREIHTDLQESKRDQIEGLLRAYPTAKTDLDSTPVNEYFKLIDSLKNPITGKVSSAGWERVDAWLATRPRSDQEIIDNALSMNKTPTEKQYREDTARIANAGYWDLQDGWWEQYSEAMDVPAWQTEEGYWTDKRQSLISQMEEYLDSDRPNWRTAQPELATLMADVSFNKQYGRYQSSVTNLKKNWRITHAGTGETALLQRWGFGGTGAADVARSASLVD